MTAVPGQKGKWWLDDADLIARENPYSFWLPSTAVLEQLRAGNHAKLIFCFDSDDPEAPRAERMWVTIKEVHSRSYKGSLDNEPEYISQLRLGDPVKFEARHVIDTDLEDPSAKEFEQYFKRCLVTHRITEDGEKPRYAYREPPEQESDSGWRFFAGDEPGEYVDDSKNISSIAVGKILNRDRSLTEIFHEPDGRWSWNELTASWQRITD